MTRTIDSRIVRKLPVDDGLNDSWFVEDSDTERLQALYDAIPQQEAQAKATRALYNLLLQVDAQHIAPVINLHPHPTYQAPEVVDLTKQSNPYQGLCDKDSEEQWFNRGTQFTDAVEQILSVPINQRKKQDIPLVEAAHDYVAALAATHNY